MSRRFRFEHGRILRQFLKAGISFFVLLFVLTFKIQAQSTVGISGTLQDPSGAAINANGTFVRFSLRNFSSQIPGAPSIPAVVGWPDKDFTPDVNGNISGNIITNAAITSPSGTFYHVCIWYRNQLFRCNDYVVGPGAFNLNTATPLSSVPTIGPSQVITQSFACPITPAVTTWTCTHNFNDLNVVVNVYDSNSKQIFPDTLTITNPNVVTLTWVTAQAGTAVIMHAGSVAIATNQPNAIVSNPTGAQSITGQGLTLTASAPLTTQGGVTGMGTSTISNINGEVYLDGVKYTTLAAAVTALPSGGTLRISAGTYSVTVSLVMATNLDIECSPNNASILQASASLNAPMITATSVNNWRIAGCVIDGNSPTNNNQFSAVQTTTSSGFKIIDNHFQNFNSRVLNISSGSSNFRIEGNEINNYGQPLPAALNGQEAIALAPVGAGNGVQDGVIVKNYIHDGNGGILIYNSTAAPSGATNTSGNQVIDNRIRALANDAIAISTSNGSSGGSLIRQNTIVRNIIRCNGWPANGTGWDSANCPPGTKQTGASASSSGVGIDIIAGTADQNTIAENHSDFNYFEGGDNNTTSHETVNTSNGALGGCAANCVQITSGDNFPTIVANQGMMIGSTQFLIASQQSSTVMTLTTAPGTQTGVAAIVGICSHDVWIGNFFNSNGNGAPLGGQGAGLAIQGCKVTSVGNQSGNNAAYGFIDQIAAHVIHNGDRGDSDCRIQNCQEFFAQAALNPTYQGISTNARVNSWGLWFDLNTIGGFGESPSICSVNATCGSVNVTDNGTNNRFSDGRVRGAGAGSASIGFQASSGTGFINYGGGAGAFNFFTPAISGYAPVVVDHNGTQKTGAVHIVQDVGTLAAGTLAVTLTGSAPFFNAGTYTCLAKDTTTPANVVTCTQTSGSAITFTGTGTDVISYTLIGN